MGLRLVSETKYRCGYSGSYIDFSHPHIPESKQKSIHHGKGRSNITANIVHDGDIVPFDDHFTVTHLFPKRHTLQRQPGH